MRHSLRLFSSPRGLAWRRVHWPATLEPEHAVGLFRQLGTDHYVPLLVLEAEGTSSGIEHRVGVRPSSANRVAELFQALIPSGAMTVADERSPESAAWRIVLSTRHRPLHFSDPERVTRALLATLSTAAKSERILGLNPGSR